MSGKRNVSVCSGHELGDALYAFLHTSRSTETEKLSKTPQMWSLLKIYEASPFGNLLTIERDLSFVKTSFIFTVFFYVFIFL